jgi:hypothetical protein
LSVIALLAIFADNSRGAEGRFDFFVPKEIHPDRDNDTKRRIVIGPIKEYFFLFCVNLLISNTFNFNNIIMKNYFKDIGPLHASESLGLIRLGPSTAGSQSSREEGFSFRTDEVGIMKVTELVALGLRPWSRAHKNCRPFPN